MAGPDHNMEKKAAESLSKLLPRLKTYCEELNKSDWSELKRRIEQEFETLFHYLYLLYGDHYDFFYYLEEVLKTAISASCKRSNNLKNLDLQRLDDPYWFKSHKQIGVTGYADLLAG